MAIDPISEESCAAIRAGDRVAFEKLFRAWYGPLADYAARLVESPDAAEDVVQGVFVSLWNRRDALPEAHMLTAYLHRSVRNRALNHLRDQKTTRTLPFPTVDEPSIAPTIETELDIADLETALQSALSELAPRTREVFLLSRHQELTYSAIASTLGISVKTVETLMGRALKALRARLREGLGP